MPRLREIHPCWKRCDNFRNQRFHGPRESERERNNASTLCVAKIGTRECAGGRPEKKTKTRRETEQAIQAYTAKLQGQVRSNGDLPFLVVNCVAFFFWAASGDLHLRLDQAGSDFRWCFSRGALWRVTCLASCSTSAEAHTEVVVRSETVSGLRGCS